MNDDVIDAWEELPAIVFRYRRRYRFPPFHAYHDLACRAEAHAAGGEGGRRGSESFAGEKSTTPLSPQA